jgi:multidrug efflux pump subunit AcrA (membrane-fusion protein)
MSLPRRGPFVLLLSGMATAAGLAAGCGRSAAPTAAADTGPRAVAVTVDEVRRRPVVRTVEMVGTMKGWEEVTIGSKRTGRVAVIRHDMGDLVPPGEPLVELEVVDAAMALQESESRLLSELAKIGLSLQEAEAFVEKFGVSEQLIRGEAVQQAIDRVPAVVQSRVAREKAQSDLNRQRQLTQRGASSYQELQDLEIAFRNAEAAYGNARVTAQSVIASAVAAYVARSQAQQLLDDLTIRVPVPSSAPAVATKAALVYAVTKRVASEGQMLREGDPVAELAILNPLRLWANVPERFSGEVANGQDVDLRVVAYDRPFAGKVTRINPAVDPVSRTFQVEVAVPNDEGLLRPGGFAKASVITRRDDGALVVPRESIVRFAGVTKLFVLDGAAPKQTARAVNVTTGLEGEGWVEVNGSLQEGQAVATSGLTQLADGTPVTIRTPDSAPAPDAGAKAEADAKPAGATPAPAPAGAAPKS